MQNGFALRNKQAIITKEIIEIGIFRIFRYFSKE